MARKDFVELQATITNVISSGADNTVTVLLDVAGEQYSFNGGVLGNKAKRDYFVDDLCATFGVADKSQLVGRTCTAVSYKSKIEEIVGSNGTFVLTNFRNTRLNDNDPGPVERRKKELRANKKALQDRLAAIQKEIDELDAQP